MKRREDGYYEHDGKLFQEVVPLELDLDESIVGEVDKIVERSGLTRDQVILGILLEKFMRRES